MLKSEAKKRIISLLGQAELDFEWGGGEDAEGTLSHGYVDFDDLKARISEVIDDISITNDEEDYLDHLNRRIAKLKQAGLIPDVIVDVDELIKTIDKEDFGQ